MNFYLLYQLVLKDFRVRYRNTAAGLLWSLLNPLVMMVVLTVVISSIGRSPVPNFPVFVLIGLIPWNFFSLTLSAATSSIVDNAILVKKIAFPRSFLPVSVVLANLVHFVINLGLLFVFLVFYRTPLTWAALCLPAIVLLQIGLLVGLSLLLAGLHVHYRDIRYLVDSVLMILFWLSPIFYPLSLVPHWLLGPYLLNPVAGLIDAYREVLLQGQLPSLLSLGSSAAVSVTLLGVGFLIFGRQQKHFADVI
jgi:lipopolysaccharide transport system permease protein